MPSSTHDLCWLRGASFRPRYLGYGRAGPLYACISDLQGMRGHLEQIAMATIGRVRSPRAVGPDLRYAWERVQSFHDGDIRAALFVYTGYYKDAILSGIVLAQDATFVKAFDSERGHRDEARRLEQLRGIVPPSIALAPLRHAARGVVGYGLLERSRGIPSEAWLLDAASQIGTQSLRCSASHSGRDWASLTGETARLLTAFGLPDHSLHGLPNYDRGPLAVAHGDFTQWNTFAAADGRLALVDYERVALRAPFTDVWHLVTQCAALSGSVALPEDAFAFVAAAAHVPRANAVRWYLAYLMEELCIDLTDWVVHARKHSQLRALITAKANVLGRARDLARDA